MARTLDASDSQAATNSLRLGSRRRYELLRELASGGMGSVYLGRARAIGGFERLVAIKCCHPHLAKDDAFAAMFIDEAKLAARIHHPNVVATLDVDRDETLYLVMEYVEGGSVARLLAEARERDGRVPTDITLRIMLDALAGLHAAHELRAPDGRALEVIHRDVTPHNVLVGIDGVARIVDFGIAKAKARAVVTKDGELKGKLAYMPPEQLAFGEVTRQADVYSAGVVLWEALTGESLFRGDTDRDTMASVIRGKAARPSEHSADVDPRLDDIVLRAMHRDPTKRYRTAAALAEALEATKVPIANARTVGAYVSDVLADELAGRRVDIGQAPTLTPSGAEAAATTPRRAATASPRRRAIYAVIALTIVGLVCGALLLLAGEGSSDRAPAAPRAARPAAPSVAAPRESPAEAPPAVPPPVEGVEEEDQREQPAVRRRTRHTRRRAATTHEKWWPDGL